MYKGNGVCTYNSILVSFNKEGNPVTCISVDDPEGHYAKLGKPETEGQIYFIPLR